MREAFTQTRQAELAQAIEISFSGSSQNREEFAKRLVQEWAFAPTVPLIIIMQAIYSFKEACHDV